jgi:hypothetical protein
MELILGLDISRFSMNQCSRRPSLGTQNTPFPVAPFRLFYSLLSTLYFYFLLSIL